MSKTILIIDDDPNIIALLENFIKPMGFEILTASDGMAGLELARTKRPALILLDIMLPKLDGYKISRFLKFDDTYSSIPIVMLTAKSDAKDQQIGKQTGADAYVTKPFNKNDIVKLINELVK